MFASTVVLLFSLLGLNTAQEDWTYRDENAWPGQCTVGLEQSPINIEWTKTRIDPLGLNIRGPLVYTGYERVNATAKNTGYTIRWAPVVSSPAPVLSGGPLQGTYTFVDLHFHWLSEHTLEGLKYPLEIHMVHVKTGLTQAEALQRPDGLAVIGILADVGTPDSSTVLDDLLPAIPYILEKSGESPPDIINLRSMFSSRPQQYYTYHGSLTTPECNEVVTWIVMANPILIPHENYKTLTQAHFNGTNNDRSVQAINNRVVYRSRELASCSNAISPSYLGSWAMFLGCLTSNMSSKIYRGVCGFGNIKRRLFGLPFIQCD